MEKAVSAADANRKFPKLLRGVRGGHSYVVTSHGKAVARIVPIDKNGGVARGARAALIKSLRSEPVVTIGPGNEQGRHSPSHTKATRIESRWSRTRSVGR